MASLRPTSASACFALAIATFGTAATAEPTPAEKTLATALFEEGRTLLAKGDVAAACAKLSESQRLDPGGGTLLNVALCHEREGRTATAHQEFKEALALAQRDRRPERVEAAQKHIDVLAPKLARIVVKVGTAAAAERWDVRVDEVQWAPASWGTPVPVDPGTHTVRATAPGRVAFEKKIAIAEASEQVVEIAGLAAIAQPSSPAKEAAPVSASSSRKTWGWVSLGVGVAAVGVGSWLGWRAIGTRRDVVDACPDRARCDTASAAKNDDAVRDADRSTIAFALGGAAVGVGAYLLLKNPDPTPTARWVAPAVGPTSVGVASGGAF